MKRKYGTVKLVFLLVMTSGTADAAAFSRVDCPRVAVIDLEIMQPEVDKDLFEHINFYKHLSEQNLHDRITVTNEKEHLFSLQISEPNADSYSPIRTLPLAVSSDRGISVVCTKDGVILMDALVQTMEQQVGGPFLYNVRAKLELKAPDASIGVKWYLLHDEKEPRRDNTPALVVERKLYENGKVN